MIETDATGYNFKIEEIMTLKVWADYAVTRDWFP